MIRGDPATFGRRRFLRGAGAIVALPWLESLARAASRQAPPTARPTRMAFLYMPNGALPSAWNPAEVGPDWVLTPTLAPLASVKRDVLVLTGLANANSRDGDGHYAKTAPFLTGCAIRRTAGRDLQNGVSVDQVAAAALGDATPLRSLELGTEPVRPVEDMGYTTVYGGHISWRTPDTPCTKEIVPRLAFDRLFRAQALRDGGLERSVLDVVLEDARRLEAELGHVDRGKLADYFDSVRDLERRIDRCERQAVVASAPPAVFDLEAAPPAGLPRDHATHVELMLDLLVLAFRTDATRIATFLFGNAVSGKEMSFLPGVKGGHHDLSHHEGRAEKQAQYQLINRWHVEQFARFVEKLAAIDDGDGLRLLDRSMLLFGSALKDGNSHDPEDLPILLAGRGLGATEMPLPMGEHRRFERGTPLCNLWLTMLQQMGVAAERFGDSSGALLR